MTDPSANGNQKARRILGPHIWPLRPEGLSGGEAYYLSWPGWELYLSRRLKLIPAEADLRPLLLTGVNGPEQDFAAIDQLAKSAAELGAACLELVPGQAESRWALTSAIREYRLRSSADAQGRPFMDDRSYLALWTIVEFQSYESEQLLAQAAEQQRAMWSALKGEEDSGNSPEEDRADRPGQLDARTEYAWSCWHRLAAPLLAAEDLIVPTAAALEE